MQAVDFFEHLLKELEINPELKGYYRFLNSKNKFLFRKAHFMQRLEFIEKNVTDKNAQIWDCGCGYGTTAIFLALNGYKVYGTTLEYYYKQLPARFEYWSKFGDIKGFTYGYENIFDKHPPANSTDIVILQDTLHHLEPVDEAFRLFYTILKPGGKLLISEVNGDNIFERTKFFIQRGNKRIIEIYDEQLKKKILFGNENIRTAAEWERLILAGNMEINPVNLTYIRYYMPLAFTPENYKDLIDREQKLWRKNSWLKKYFFFGINFIAEKK